jgi:hypothetical protein
MRSRLPLLLLLTPVGTDGLGAQERYVKNGRVTYVTRERVTISGNQLVVNPVASDANLVVYHLGVSLGVRRGGPPEP